MSCFIQLHLLTSYPPANLNRDDLGRPKTAVMGGAQRLRISSQSLKRAWRTSDILQNVLAINGGLRTKRLGAYIYHSLVSGKPLKGLLHQPLVSLEETIGEKATDFPAKKAKEFAWSIASVFVDKPKKKSDDTGADDDDVDDDEKKKDGKKGKKPGKSNVDKETLRNEQLVFYSTSEIEAIETMILSIREKASLPDDKKLRGLVSSRIQDADIAMFGRMLAASPDKNVEAAVQVAHAISVHKVTVEDDYFSAVDDLNFGEEDSGAGHIGETEFAAGLFYSYLCINFDLLLKNLQGDANLASAAVRALTEAAATVAPSGKQNSFASRAYASYILAEKGSRQPRSLSVAFLKPISGTDMLADAIKALKDTRDDMDKVYGKLAESVELNAKDGTGSLPVLLDFATGPCVKTV